MPNKFKVKITKTIYGSMTQETFDLLSKACFEDDDSQMLNEMYDFDCDGELSIERV